MFYDICCFLVAGLGDDLVYGGYYLLEVGMEIKFVTSIKLNGECSIIDGLDWWIHL
jgi:hypothetical protein